MTTKQPSFTVKGYKSFRGMDTAGFNATLYMDDQRVAFIIDDGCGGCCSYENQGPAWEAFRAYVKALPADMDAQSVELFGPEGWKRDMDAVVSGIVGAYEQDKQLRGWCKKKTVFRIKGDKAGVTRVIARPYDAAIKAHIVAKYGDTVEEILNERFAA